MTQKSLVIIAIEEEFLCTVFNQMKEIFSDIIRIRSIRVKDLAGERIEEDEAVLLSSKLIQQLVKPFLPRGIHCIVAKRGLNYVNMKKLLSLPSGKNILIVNDNKINTDETVQEFRESIFEHNYYPYYPDTPISENIDLVVTVGEKELVPLGMENVIDIGPRVIDLETIYELFDYFQLNHKRGLVAKRYIKSLVSMSTALDLSKEDMGQSIGRENEYIAKYTFNDLIAYSKKMKDLVSIAEKFAKKNDPIHILGEIGTGKSVMAQAIHNESYLHKGPYVSINCAARSADVLEREIFGWEGDGKVTLGLFELAKGGTLCIEEVGEISPGLQGRLIQAIGENRIIRIGGDRPIPINVRVITTSSMDLWDLVGDGLFRKDLFYLLSTLICKIPSLSQRMDDFEPLINKYLQQNLRRGDLIISQEVMDILKDHPWHGNVQELFNVISYLACTDEKVITPNALPFFINTQKEEKPIVPIKIDEEKLIRRIEKHGFLEESLAILSVFQEGKKRHTSYGRTIVRKLLEKKGIHLSDQQLRYRLEILNNLNLLIVRPGRSGTTISMEGEEFLHRVKGEAYEPVGGN